MRNVDVLESPLSGYYGYNPEFAARVLRDVKAREKQRREAEALAAAEKRKRAKAELREMHEAEWAINRMKAPARPGRPNARQPRQTIAGMMHGTFAREMMNKEFLAQVDKRRAPTVEADQSVLHFPSLPIRKIVAFIAETHGVSVADVLGRSRFKEHYTARRDAIVAVASAKPGLPLSQIGMAFNRDYKAILHALGRTIQARKKAARVSAKAGQAA